MSKKRNYKIKNLLTILVLMNKRLIEWSLENIQGKYNIDDMSGQEKNRIQVVAIEDLGKNYGMENTNFYFIRTKDIFDKLSKYQRDLLEKEVLSINDIFSDERFIRAYFDGTHEDVMSVIEKMYFEFKMNAKMLRVLEEVGLIKLTSEDKNRFGEIRLLYSWDDPIFGEVFTDQEMLEMFKSNYGIK